MSLKNKMKSGNWNQMIPFWKMKIDIISTMCVSQKGEVKFILLLPPPWHTDPTTMKFVYKRENFFACNIREFYKPPVSPVFATTFSIINTKNHTEQKSRESKRIRNLAQMEIFY